MSPTGEKPSDARRPPGSPEEKFEAQVAKMVRGKSPDDMAALRPQFEQLADELGVPEGNANQIVKLLEPKAKRLGARTPSGVPPAKRRGIPLSEVKEESVTWFWPGRVPFGALTDLVGPPGVGKSTIAVDLAARLTTGRQMPGSDATARKPAAVVLLTSEDNLVSTVKPRLRSARGDSRLVFGNPTVTDPTSGERPYAFPADVALFEAFIVEHGALLVVMDPLVAFLDAGINPHVDKDVRRALGPLAAVAERTGAAFLLIRHLNKSRDDDPITRGGGSIGFIAQVRSGLLVHADPEDNTGERRVLASVKLNVGPKPPSLGYTLSARSGEAMAHVEWGSETSITANQLLGAPSSDGDRTVRGEAEDIIRECVSRGPLPVKDARDAVAKAGVTISDRTFDRVVERLDVTRQRQGFGPGSKIMLVPGPSILATPAGEHGGGEYEDQAADQVLEGVEGNGSRHTRHANGVASMDGPKANGKLPGTLSPAAPAAEGD